MALGPIEISSRTGTGVISGPTLKVQFGTDWYWLNALLSSCNATPLQGKIVPEVC